MATNKKFQALVNEATQRCAEDGHNLVVNTDARKGGHGDIIVMYDHRKATFNTQYDAEAYITSLIPVACMLAEKADGIETVSEAEWEHLTGADELKHEHRKAVEQKHEESAERASKQKSKKVEEQNAESVIENSDELKDRKRIEYLTRRLENEHDYLWGDRHTHKTKSGKDSNYLKREQAKAIFENPSSDYERNKALRRYRNLWMFAQDKMVLMEALSKELSDLCEKVGLYTYSD